MSGFWKLCSFLCTQYLVGPPFAWVTASMWRGMEVISLWHCSGVMKTQIALIAAFMSSALLGLVSLIFFLIIPHRFSMVFRSGEFAGQSSTETPWSLNQLLVGSVGRCQVLLENEISIAIKLVSRRKQGSALKCPGRCVDCGLQKTQWTNTSRWNGSPNHHWLWKLHTRLVQHGFCASPLFLQTLGPWFPN